MRKHVDQLLRVIDIAKIDPAIRRNVITFIIAKHVSCELPLPTSPVNSAKLHFNEQVRASVFAKLSAFNEWTVIDTEAAARLVYQMWLLRYRLVHEPRNYMAVAMLNCMEMSGDAVEIPSQFVDAMRSVEKAELEKLCYFADKALNEDTGGVEPKEI